MNTRIKKLRKALGLTQQEFAYRIGVKRNTVATYEMGRSTPSDSGISLICREFRVNEKWLRTGSGEMFLPNSESELLEVVTRYGLPPALQVVLVEFTKLNQSEQATVINYMESVSLGIIERLFSRIGVGEEMDAFFLLMTDHLYGNKERAERAKALASIIKEELLEKKEPGTQVQSGKESSSEDK